MAKGKRFMYVKAFEGEPTFDNFKLEEYDLPPLKNGEVLCEAVFLSVDPYMRAYMARFPVGCKMIGSQIARILDSKNPKYQVSSIVCGDFGWQTHTIFSDETNNDVVILKNYDSLPHSYGLGCLGMPGNTAYFGLLELCKPVSGETVVVSGAAGAVGCLVGQIAKIKGCRVIGFAGADDKCEWLTKECGFDYAFNYKSSDIAASLKEAAPNGVDCYFDNVGGEMSSTIINHMNLFGRISVCGSISAYNADMHDMPKATVIQPAIVTKQMKMEGFIVNRWKDRRSEAFVALLKWIKEGKIQYKETITEGFENMPTAFMQMLKGHNTGKAVVKA